MNVLTRMPLLALVSSLLLVLAVDTPLGTAPSTFAAFPGPNGLIALSSTNTISVVNPDGTGLEQVYSLPAGSNCCINSPARWSPDGSRLAFSDPRGISTIDANGSDAVLVKPWGDTGARYPAWSPDGQRIVFVQFTPPAYDCEVWTMDDDGANERKVMTCLDNANPPLPVWSPDGSKIAFGQSDVYTVNVDGSALTNLTNTDDISEYGADWSPDGSKLFTSTPFNDSEDTNVVNADGSGWSLLLPGIPGAIWSPDGTKIAYKTAGNLYVADESGANPALVTPSIPGGLDWGTASHLLKVEFTQAIQELQEAADLENDLDADGKPPVPIVAGKPAAMRIYFDEVDAPTSYDIQVTGRIVNSALVNLVPGCDVEQRRKQENNCKSVDFYLTPPQGNWSVRLEVRDVNGVLIKDYDFNFTSDDPGDIELKAVSVCDLRTPGVRGVWLCEDAKKLGPLLAFLRKIAPTDSVSVFTSHRQVRRDSALFPTPEKWRDKVARDIHSYFGIVDQRAVAATGDEIYYFGMARPTVPGSFNGAANGVPSRGAFARSIAMSGGRVVTPETVAHEVFHMAGRDHTGTPAPLTDCWQSTVTNPPSDWPWADNMLRSGPDDEDIEVGFDVGARKALPGDENFEIMGYCLQRWISPHTTANLLAPLGPLRAPAAGPSSESGPFLLVAGDLTAGAVEFGPLFRYETEASVEPGSGSHRIELQDGGGTPLFIRAFHPVASSPDLPPDGEDDESTPFFAELIPVQPGAARIAVFDDTDAEIGSLALEGAQPTVNITNAGTSGDTVDVAWSVQDPDSTEHTYWIDYSPDAGQTWQNQGMGLTKTSLAIAADSLAGSDSALFRIIASDGVNSAEAVSAPFTVAKKLPEGEVAEPSGGAYRLRDLVWLQAAAFDPDDGFLDDDSVRWSSSRDGNLGSGASLPVYDLSLGEHTITMTARDSDDNTVTDTVQVTIFDGPIVEGGQQVLWGDLDCDGGLTTRDNQALLRRILQQNPLSQTEPCPALGAVVDVSGTGDRAWGDLDCDGEITTRDNQALQRRVLQQAALSQTQPCPTLGSPATVQE